MEPFPATIPPEKVARFGGGTPMGRAGQQRAPAPARVRPASDKAPSITGATVPVTGGRPFP